MTAWHWQPKSFEVPAETRMLLFFPEIFDRDILQKDPKFRYKYEEKGVTKVGGFKTPCPWCKSNAHVKLQEKSGYQAGQHRTISDFRGMIPIYCFKAICSSPTCIGDPTKAKNDG